MTRVATVRRSWFSHTEFDVCREVVGIEEFPVILRLPSPGRSPEERRRIVAQCLDDLRGRGLADAGGPTWEVGAALEVLARPAGMVDARVWHPERRRVALGGVRGQAACVATVDPRGVELLEVSADSLVAAVVAVAGEHRAGPGRSVSVPTELMLRSWRATRGGRRFAEAVTVGGVRADDARELAAMMDGAGARGQFGAEAVSPSGRRRRAGRVVAWHDTPSGRYLQLRRPGRPGTPDWSTVTPASPDRLAAQVQDLLDEARTAARQV